MSVAKKEKRAIEYLKAFEPKDEPYYLCYSGGKDSDCIRILAELAGVKTDIKHNLTTVDAPETVHYVQKTIGRGWAESKNRRDNGGVVKILGKEKTMEKLATENELDFIKTGKGGIVMNNDNSETRRFVEMCYRTTSTMVNPIIDWEDDEVWEFLHYYGCESNPLYQCGQKRIGCIGCPLQGFKGMKDDFLLYPKYRAAYVRAFDKMVIAREQAGLTNNGSWRDGESVMRWWVGDDPNQMTLEDYFKNVGIDWE